MPTGNQPEYYGEVRDVFDAAATEKGGYYDAPAADRPRHTLPQRLNRRHILTALDRLHAERFDSCLDAGCGMADFAHLLGVRYRFAHVHGTDFSWPMLRLARQRYGGTPPPVMSFSRQDLAGGLGLRDRMFDLSVCLNVIHHVLPSDQPRLFAELCRVTRSLLVVEIKCPHVLHRMLTGYRAFGKLPVYPLRPDQVAATVAPHGFRPAVTAPIFGFLPLSPIAVMVFARHGGGTTSGESDACVNG